MTTLIQQHRGCVVDSSGDNLPAEFASVVAAVQGAIAIQHPGQLLRVQHGSHRHCETFEQRRGRLRPACKNAMFYIGSPCQA